MGRYSGALQMGCYNGVLQCGANVRCDWCYRKVLSWPPPLPGTEMCPNPIPMTTRHDSVCNDSQNCHSSYSTVLQYSANVVQLFPLNRSKFFSYYPPCYCTHSVCSVWYHFAPAHHYRLLFSVGSPRERKKKRCLCGKAVCFGWNGCVFCSCDCLTCYFGFDVRLGVKGDFAKEFSSDF